MSAACTVPGVPGTARNLHAILRDLLPSRSRVLRNRPDMNALREAVDETVSLYLPEPGHLVHVQLEVTEEQARVHVAGRPDVRLHPPAGAGPR